MIFLFKSWHSSKASSNGAFMPVENTPKRVLLLEKNPGDTLLIREILQQSSDILFELSYFDRLSAGLESLKQQTFDIILLDLSLPDTRGLESVVQISQAAPAIPILILSHLHDEPFAKEALRCGAQDYVIKSRVNGLILWRIIDYAIARKKFFLPQTTTHTKENAAEVKQL